MKALKSNALIFLTGAIGYAIIELLWRGHTHPTMILAGGLSFISFSFISKKLRNTPLLIKAVLASLTVTLIELIFGIVFNVWLEMAIWDYTDQPFNFLGQICPLFSIFWFALAVIFIPLADRMNKLFSLDKNSSV